MVDSGITYPEETAKLGWQGAPEGKQSRLLDGILWVLCTGAAWQDLTYRYPSPVTCYRRFQEWHKEGLLESILQALARHLKERDKLDPSECFIDGLFVVAKSGAGSWKDQVRQRYGGHGVGRPLRSSYRHPH